jgi:transposase-like protein
VARITVTQLAKDVPDEDAAYLYLEGLRWPNQPVCPHCGSINDHYFLTPKGEGRKTRTGSVSARRVWKCKDCRKQFSVTTGTFCHGTRVSLRVWIFVLFEMAANKNGIAAREIERKYGVAPKTAWLMTQKIRTAIGNRAPHMMVGTIVADESWVGGDPTNDHHRKPEPTPEVVNPGGSRPNQKTAKTPVLSLIDADTGELRSRVVTEVSAKTLREVIADQVNMSASHLMTDESASYQATCRESQSHETVNHSEREYARGSVSINLAENFFSQLTRSIDGTHHHVSKEHLHRYLGEFDFRYSTRKVTDTERMGMLADRTAGVRVSYKRVKRTTG